MIISSRGFIFVHIPKTAGSSIAKALGADWQNHKDLKRYRHELGPAALADFFVCTVVRNPWDRLVSDYRFQSRLGGHRDSKLHVFDENGRKRSFAQWLDAVINDPFKYPASVWGGSVSEGIHRWSPQTEWISLDGRIAVDEIIRFEQLGDGLAGVASRLGIEVPPLPHLKRSFRSAYPDYYDARTRRLVEEVFAGDIQAFGYSFDESQTGSGGLFSRLASVFRPRRRG